MAAPANDYTGCTVLLYSEDGAYIHESEVLEYDAKDYELRLKGGIPKSLKLDDKCSLLILTEPTPREYQGRVITEKFGYDRVFVLFRGRPKEMRGTTRYRTNFPASIQALHRSGEIYRLYNPIPAQVINMGRTGLRLSTPVNTLRRGDRASIVIHLEDSKKILTIQVTNYKDDEYQSEYGCRLVAL